MTTMSTYSRPKDVAGVTPGILPNLHAARRQSGPRIRRRIPSVSKEKSITRGEGVAAEADTSGCAGCGAESEQDIRFINIPSQDDPHKEKPAKVIVDPMIILKKSQETSYNLVYDIDIHGQGLTNIENLDKFVRVRVLDLSCNHICEIANLDENVELRELKLYDNVITTIANLESVKELCHLQLQHNKIQNIGRGLLSLRKLRVLRLDSNYIYKLEPREFAACSQLTSLDLSNNKIDNIAAVNSLPNLEELFVVNNRLRSITDLHRCKKLHEVDVSYNKIADLSGLKGLAQLTILHASHNQLSNMKSVGKLKGLQELNLSKNRLTDTGSLCEFYPSLQILDISDNHIESWQCVVQLKDFRELAELYISGNPFSGEGGEQTHYFLDTQKMLPGLEILDGAMVKKTSSKPGTPVMRPMSASTVVTSRQVQSQLNIMMGDLESFETDFSKKFDELRQSFSVLPADSPSRSDSVLSSARPVSKCGKRSRIKEAQEFAHSLELPTMKSLVQADKTSNLPSNTSPDIPDKRGNKTTGPPLKHSAGSKRTADKSRPVLSGRSGSGRGRQSAKKVTRD